MLSILHIFGILAGDVLAFAAGVLGVVASSIVLCCMPKVGAAGCGYVAAMVVCAIATLVHLLNVILTIIYWAAWTRAISRTHGIHALLVIALIFHVSVTACTMTLTYKCRKAHKVAKNEMAAPQTVVNYPSHPGTVVTGTIVEMAPPAYEKA